MSNLSIYIVEDEPLYANQLLMLVDELDYELAGTSDNSDTAKNEILNKKPDLLLVDIKINGSMNGIDLVTEVSKELNIPAIFITSFSDKATFDRAKLANPYAYLTKPFDSSDLQRNIELAFNSGQKNRPSGWNEDVAFSESFFIKNRNKLEKVGITNILYLEVEDKYSTLFLEGGKKYVLRMSIAAVLEKLPQQTFCRVHRKYAVNLTKLKSIDIQDNLIHIEEHSITISRANKEEFLEKLEWLQ